MNVYDAVCSKRAIRQFNDQPISDEALVAILNAGRWSGSSKNNQPWHFVVLRQRDRLIALSQCGPFAGHLAGATVGIALVTGDWMERWPVAFDLGRAAQNMMLVAHEMGIGSVMANIYEIEQANALLELPPELMCYSAISFGYPADPEALTQPPRAGRKRSLDEVVHWERW
ncbi:MAG: nitroreductase family protein [Caldilineales bacterium]|nr:nitroreductase family protein [Caldilineales bacterium]